MTHLHHRPRSSAFTLIELLVVIAILAVLMGIAFPVFQSVQNAARKTQAKNDLVQIVTAVNSFYTEYGKYPTTATSDSASKVGGGGTSSGTLFYELRALPSPAPTLNTRQIAFLSLPDAKDQTNPRNGIKTSDGQLFDPWGSAYGIEMDADYDNQIANPYTADKGAGGANVRQGVVAWSLGRNGGLGGGAAVNSTFTNENGTASEFTNSSDVISWQ